MHAVCFRCSPQAERDLDGIRQEAAALVEHSALGDLFRHISAAEVGAQAKSVTCKIQCKESDGVSSQNLFATLSPIYALQCLESRHIAGSIGSKKSPLLCPSEIRHEVTEYRNSSFYCCMQSCLREVKLAFPKEISHLEGVISHVLVYLVQAQICLSHLDDERPADPLSGTVHTWAVSRVPPADTSAKPTAAGSAGRDGISKKGAETNLISRRRFCSLAITRPFIFVKTIFV